ncbi:MAG: hypothetical protein H7237_07820 [Alkalinema sp. FL-bin-369]|nr:hypothetical protein [Leptolyngbyaceae cyanobacterium LF-bin-369]
MTRATTRRSTSQWTTGMWDLYALMALLGMPMMLLLYWILQQSNPNWWQNVASVLPSSLSPESTTTLPDGRQARVLKITHQAICQPGSGSLNIRPRSSFENPIAQIPCNGGVAVTGAPVWNQGESWSPVVYGTTQGWSVSRLLRKV